MDHIIIGKCIEMCPETEILLREKESLLHVLEMVPGTEFYKKPNADRTRMVKAYSRSTVGQIMQTQENLRTPDTLLRTINYLLLDVITTRTVPWNIVYDFIVDRLLAIRQDMVIQRLSAVYCISILQPIIRFHAYSAYKYLTRQELNLVFYRINCRMCEESVSKFDPVLNSQNLQECLKRLLVLYDDCDQFQTKSLNLSKTNPMQYDKLFEHSRPCMEALYVLLNLGNVNAIDRALKLPKKYKTEMIQNVLRISLCCINGNWIRLCRLFQKLPSLLAGIGALHLPKIRRLALHTMSAAYSSKNLSFPAEELKFMLLYSKLQDLIQDCEHYNITYNETNNTLHFQKGSFNINASLCLARYEAFASRKIDAISISTLVLNGILVVA